RRHRHGRGRARGILLDGAGWPVRGPAGRRGAYPYRGRKPACLTEVKVAGCCRRYGEAIREAPMTDMSRLLKPVPRYTSYPTAPHFHKGIGPEQYFGWLADLPTDAHISLYLHLPFCDRLCWFCGCHTKQVNRYDPI